MIQFYDHGVKIVGVFIPWGWLPGWVFSLAWELSMKYGVGEREE